jgi:1-deoxyxylulose-5-phosphate synthase
MLTGKYKKGEAAPEGSRWGDYGVTYQKRFWSDATFDTGGVVAQVAAEAGASPAQAALAWALSQK